MSVLQTVRKVPVGPANIQKVPVGRANSTEGTSWSCKQYRRYQSALQTVEKVPVVPANSTEGTSRSCKQYRRYQLVLQTVQKVPVDPASYFGLDELEYGTGNRLFRLEVSWFSSVPPVKVQTASYHICFHQSSKSILSQGKKLLKNLLNKQYKVGTPYLSVLPQTATNKHT
jgi:hypothetical protein